MAINGVVEATSAAAQTVRQYRTADARFALALEREAASGAFVYRGCYRARGALTLAERAAYGLHQEIRRKKAGPAAIPLRRAPTAEAPAALVQGVKRKTLLPQERSRALRRAKSRLKIVCALPVVVRMKDKPVAAATKSLKQRVLPWYRVRVNADGASVSCLIFRGRAFIGSAPRRRGA